VQAKLTSYARRRRCSRNAGVSYRKSGVSGASVVEKGLEMKTRSEADKQAERVIITEEIRKMIGDATFLIESNGVSFTEAQRIAGWIAEIRQLLSEWAEVESRCVPARPIAEDVRVLRERSMELEGLVKEVRNGLEREQRRARLVKEKGGKD
jgi:hypothetical protein